MDVVAIIVVVAGVATVLSLAYLASIGSRSLPDWWRERRKVNKSGLALREPLPPITTEVAWDAVRDGVTRFTDLNTREYDLIVGIAKGGLPIAVAVANRLPAAGFSAMLKKYVDTKHAPFFVFEEGTNKRSIRTKQVNFALPLEIPPVRRALIVDDVTTFGNSLATAESLVLGQFPEAEIDFFVFAADLSRLAASRPSIADRTRCAREVDNRAEWLRFPWE
jgi:adenine/guanine phosphoribosyltransferase-like PRPP-binding protein